MRDSQQPPEALDCLSHAGFVRHAFTLAFIHLRRQTAFESAICQTLCCGGVSAAAAVGLLAVHPRFLPLNMLLPPHAWTLLPRTVTQTQRLLEA